jgi:uncharacterized membrane protein YesL
MERGDSLMTCDEEVAMGQGWVARAGEITDTVLWVLKLNGYWWLFTLLGLGLFGIGPATATGAILVRRRNRGESTGLRATWQIYRTEFVSANLVLTPAWLLAGLLASNLGWFAAGTAAAPWWITLAALAFVVTVLCFLAPLYACYDLPRRRYLLTAIKIALARPLWGVLMSLITVALVFASSKIVILAPVLAVGVWLHTTSWLGLRFFAENEDRLAARKAAEAAAGSPDPTRTDPTFTLPTEPLRMN